MLHLYRKIIQYITRVTKLIFQRYVAGDCGFGFEMPGYYEQIFRRHFFTQ